MIVSLISNIQSSNKDNVTYQGENTDDFNSAVCFAGVSKKCHFFPGLVKLTRVPATIFLLATFITSTTTTRSTLYLL